MDYKVLVIVYVPEIEQRYEMYIPINKTISQVLLVLNKIINEISSHSFPIKNNLLLFDRKTGITYKNSDIVRNTNIRNGSEVIII